MTDRGIMLASLVERGARLEIWCAAPGCHRQAHMSPAEAVEKLGGRTTFLQAARRLRCTHCGERGRDGRISCRPDVLDDADRRWSERQAKEAQRWTKTNP